MRLLLAIALLVSSTIAHAKPAKVTACRDQDCIRDFVPRDKKPTMSANDCRVFDGKVDKANFDEDLGMLCRLIVARAQASFRTVAPCITPPNDPNPDFEMAIEEGVSRELHNQLLGAPLLKKYNVERTGGSGGSNGSTVHGSYIWDAQFNSGKKQVSWKTFFCIAESPSRYVPYFYALKVDKKYLETGFVESPNNEPILGQIGAFKTGDEKGSGVLTDVNGDGQKDFIIVRRDRSKGYFPAVCLHNPRGTACTPIVATEPLPSDEMFVDTSLTAKNGELTLELRTEGKVTGVAKYLLQGTALKKMR